VVAVAVGFLHQVQPIMVLVVAVLQVVELASDKVVLEELCQDINLEVLEEVLQPIILVLVICREVPVVDIVVAALKMMVTL
jgi:hypothetical protein